MSRGAGRARVTLVLIGLLGGCAPDATEEPLSDQAPRERSAFSGQDGAIERLSWLAGCWQREQLDRLTQEQWTAPLGKTMLGVSRTVVAGETVAFEYLRIKEAEGKLSLVALPSGQAEATFRQSELSDFSVAFSNPQHDFPQRILYRLLPDGSLLAQIQGTQDGKNRTTDFPMLPIPCNPQP